MAKLVRPTSRYKASYLSALREFHREGRYTYHDLDELDGDFEAHVADERKRIHPENIAVYRVPETIYWLVDGDEFIGRLELRHELNDHLLEVGGHIGYSIRPGRRREGYGTTILELALQKACECGMQRVLLTCDPDNVASRKIIEKNGGEFENRVDVVRDGMEYHKLRFWIDVESQLSGRESCRA
ncbi:GNAT family N-acetyltransferase [Persicimonas caeni]|jgi:predicted acetyltransferase|uniref:GNAT family N-acetyltransferase n=1 Tax=Persicimonas caeni TaxID=2292766 RepID=A0A4Y6PV28_PERCE|nr:GNAT family N-acetyltransferase [Persicimonas caeni]QDG51605.1 GNAT family N-acetyltransferase [Persicimonas caeni]QED32826.1 GNAT family N-acetyltransferase [Persicimonas caeni]